ncbi:MAG: phosphoglycerate kinase [Planctomycetes bacterium]|nr:phosphoglycerate kinase [Planctomycetota bacterium]
MSHLGRPDEESDQKQKYTLKPVAVRLGELLKKTVAMLPDCIGPEVAAHVVKMRDGDVALLENLRFHEAEQIKDKKAATDPKLKDAKESFAKQIADLGDIYVNDAFGTCHRDNASMLTVPQLMKGRPRVVGYLVQKELRFLGEALRDPKRPFVCVLGGAKVSDKLGVIRVLLGKCDTLLIGGAMAYTFFAADGIAVGKSLVEHDLFETAGSLRKDAGKRLVLPEDSLCAAEIKRGIAVKVFAGAETPPFDAGTIAVAKAMAEATKAGAVTIVGGGDSAAAVDRAGVADQMTHISTGGGASLEFLEGKPFKPLEVLDDP